MYFSRQLIIPALILMITALCQIRVAYADNVPNRTFELRTFTVPRAQLGSLHHLFQTHSGRFFIKYGIQVIAIWMPQNDSNPGGQLICVLAHPDRELAKMAWQQFISDEQWQLKVAESGIPRSTLAESSSQLYDPAPYSPLR